MSDNRNNCQQSLTAATNALPPLFSFRLFPSDYQAIPYQVLCIIRKLVYSAFHMQRLIAIDQVSETGYLLTVARERAK